MLSLLYRMASNKKSSTSAVYLTKLGRIKSWTVFFCLVGLVLSGYALFVEHQKEKDETYTAMCDINEHVSCSKVFTSKYDIQLFKIYESQLIVSVYIVQVWQGIWTAPVLS